MKTRDILKECLELLDERGSQYGSVEDNFDVISKIASLILDKPISKYDVAMIFYAGHGFQVGNKNYIVPSDFDVSNSTADVGSIAIDIAEKVEDFVSSIPKYPKGSLDERIEFETIQIDQMLALVWTPYKFYFNNQFSHCGINCFQLVRFDSGWKIQSIIDTRRKTSCQ